MSDFSTRPPPERVPAASTPKLSVLPLQVGVVIIASLYFAREVLIPITVAILLSFVLAPLADLLRRIGLGRVPSVLLAVIAALGIILLIGTVIGSQVAQLAPKLPEYAGTVESKFEAVRNYTLDRVSGLVERFSIGTRPAPGESKENPSASSPVRSGTATPAQQQESASSSLTGGMSPFALAERYLSPILSPIATIGIIVVVAIFVLLQREDLRDRLIRLFGATDLHRTTAAMDDAARRLSRYFLAQLAINATFGVIIGVGLFFIGVPNSILWAILAALLRFVPYFGSFISAILPVALAAAVDPGWSLAIWTAAFFIVAELLVSQAAEPIVYGHSTGLSPFAVVVAAIFWSWLWGAIGLILSMPLTLCLVVLGRHVERLEFLDILFGDRPALTPVESFYQRILAGDADEAQDHAELLLKQRSLSSYYDDVALKGMQIAANDAARGVLDQEQLERVKNTINVLVEELADHKDEEANPESADTEIAGTPKQEREVAHEPPPGDSPDRSTLPPAWRTEAPILCLAGRGPLDEAASAMLAQLLGKHGFGARVAPHEAASREAIAKLDVNGVAMVCISYLDISGSPSHLRFLMRRLRQRVPNVPILVGLWSKQDAVLRDERIGASIGADYFTTSLADAVEACVDAAKKASKSAGRAA